MPKNYKAEDFKADISVDDYIARFRDSDKFLEYCKECRNYGNSWGCPPFDFDQLSFMLQWKYLRLWAVKITPEEQGLPLSAAQEFIRPERIRIERAQLEMEKKYSGRSFAYVGKCLYCDSCTRPEGKPCRHPELVRPALEAFGFDIGKTLSELFNIEIKWSNDGKMPEYLTLVSGFFYNGKSDSIDDFYNNDIGTVK